MKLTRNTKEHGKKAYSVSGQNGEIKGRIREMKVGVAKTSLVQNDGTSRWRLELALYKSAGGM